MQTRNLLLGLAYDGTSFHGWQIQKNAKTVQAVVTAALETISGKKEQLHGCSRTDTGVHASVFCCHAHTAVRLQGDALVRALNGNLPRTIRVLFCREVPLAFHARYDCQKKTYQYYIWNAPQPHVFLQNYMLHYPYAISVTQLQQEAENFLGTHDFAAFCAAGSSVQSTVRTVQESCVIQEGRMITFRVAADGFLYHMVRIMVGTLLSVAQGKTPPGCIPEILNGRNRDYAGYTAPAQGLFLEEIQYPAFTCHGLPLLIPNIDKGE